MLYALSHARVISFGTQPFELYSGYVLWYPSKMKDNLSFLRVLNY